MMEYFLGLGRNGSRPRASSGERAACKLARLVAECGSRLDVQARAGLHEWIEYVASHPASAAEVIESWPEPGTTGQL